MTSLLRLKLPSLTQLLFCYKSNYSSPLYWVVKEESSSWTDAQYNWWTRFVDSSPIASHRLVRKNKNSKVKFKIKVKVKARVKVMVYDTQVLPTNRIDHILKQYHDVCLDPKSTQPPLIVAVSPDLAQLVFILIIANCFVTAITFALILSHTIVHLKCYGCCYYNRRRNLPVSRQSDPRSPSEEEAEIEETHNLHPLNQRLAESILSESERIVRPKLPPIGTPLPPKLRQRPTGLRLLNTL